MSARELTNSQRNSEEEKAESQGKQNILGRSSSTMENEEVKESMKIKIKKGKVAKRNQDTFNIQGKMDINKVKEEMEKEIKEVQLSAIAKTKEDGFQKKDTFISGMFIESPDIQDVAANISSAYDTSHYNVKILTPHDRRYREGYPIYSACKMSFTASDHAEERKFQCPICYKCFPSCEPLTEHMGVHSDDRPFKCPICLKRFMERDELTLHKQIHAPGVDKPHRCVRCSESFMHLIDLKRHSRMHMQKATVDCVECKKSFKRTQDLSRHLRSHSNK